MQMSFSPHDATIRTLALGAVRRLLSEPAGFGAVLGELALARVELAAPHIGYSVSLTAIREGELLPAARLYAYRYLLLAGELAIGSLDICRRGEGMPHELARIGRGPYDAALLDTLRILRATNDGDEDEYEPRLLIVPALFFCAIWLHGEQDHIAALLPTIEGFEGSLTLPVERATQLLVDAARSVQTFPGPER